MPEEQEQEITQALAALSRGASEAMDRLMPMVYGELKRIAHRQLKAESSGHTLPTTAVVHEAYLRLAEQSRADWIHRGQFFALAAGAMRRVLIDYARQHHAERRGGRSRFALDRAASTNGCERSLAEVRVGVGSVICRRERDLSS